jgi:3-oxoacyl-[acyl-carrier-protein] synthase-1
MPETRLGVIAVGARCPLGLNTLQVAMCARARKLEPRRSPFWDKRGHRAGVCATPGVSDDRYGFDRLLDLAAPALGEALHHLTFEVPPPIVLALPEAGRPGDDRRFGSAFLPALAARSRIPIDQERSQIVRAGHAGGALALEAAALSPAVPAIIVGGVDSYFHPETIAWLDEADRLHGLDAEDGFIPSEGAAFAVLTPEASLRKGAVRIAPSRAAVDGPGLLAALTDVRTNRESGELAEAMTRIVRSIAEAPGRAPSAWVLSDVNGERHRVQEWERLAARGVVADDAVHTRLPVDLGDLGAATGPMMLALCAALWRAGCAPRRSALGLLHAERGERGAFLLEAP